MRFLHRQDCESQAGEQPATPRAAEVHSMLWQTEVLQFLPECFFGFHVACSLKDWPADTLRFTLRASKLPIRPQRLSDELHLLEFLPGLQIRLATFCKLDFGITLCLTLGRPSLLRPTSFLLDGRLFSCSRHSSCAFVHISDTSVF